MKIKIKSLQVLLVVSLSLFAEESGDGAGIPGEYLIEYAADAAELGVGGSRIATVDNTASIYHNPAGIGKIEQMELLLNYSRVFNGFNYFNGAFAYPFGKYGTLGFSLTGLISPEAEGYDVWGKSNGDYRATKNTFTISYGKLLADRFTLGANVKVATESIDSRFGAGVGFDLGAQVMVREWMQFGLELMNIAGPKIKLNQDTDHYSTTLKFGIGSELLEKSLSLNLDVMVADLIGSSASFETGNHVTYPIFWNIGTEYWPIPYLALRVGLHGSAHYNPEARLNLQYVPIGLGLKVKEFEVDYAILIHTEEKDFNSTPAHSFSIRYSFGKPIPVKEQELNEKLSRAENSELIKEIQKLYINGYTQKAYDIADSTIKKQPNNSELKEVYETVKIALAKEKCGEYYQTAKKAIDNGEYEKADKELAKLFELTPNDSVALLLKEKIILQRDNSGRTENIKSLYAKKMYDEMLLEISVILKVDSTNAIALEYREKVSDYANQKEADRHYAQASKLYHDDNNIEDANSELQEALKIMPNHKEALALYEKLSKEIKEMYLKKVGTIVDNNDLDVNNESLKKLIELDVQDRIIEARKLLKAGRFKEAESLINSVLKDSPENEPAKELASNISIAKNGAESKLLYSEALKLYNENRLSGAEQNALEAVNLDKSNIAATDLLSKIQLTIRKQDLSDAEKLVKQGKQKDLENAVKLIEAYREVDSENESATELLATAKSKLLIIDANKFIDKGEYEKANRAIEKALSVNPDSKEVQGAFKNIKEVIEMFIN